MPAETSSAACRVEGEGLVVPEDVVEERDRDSRSRRSSVFFSLTKPAPFGAPLRSSDVSVEALRATVLLTNVTLCASSIVDPAADVGRDVVRDHVVRDLDARRSVAQPCRGRPHRVEQHHPAAVVVREVRRDVVPLDVDAARAARLGPAEPGRILAGDHDAAARVERVVAVDPVVADAAGVAGVSSARRRGRSARCRRRTRSSSWSRCRSLDRVALGAVVDRDARPPCRRPPLPRIRL